MNYRELIDALTFLKENRKLGSEADELVAPFKGLVCSAQFRFESLSRTFANPHDPQFEGGQTMVGDLIGSEVDFSLLLPPEQTEWVESLERGEEFGCSVNFLGFDGLYQRGIFGFVGKLEPEDEIDSLSDDPEEQVDEPATVEESVEVEEEEEEAPTEDGMEEEREDLPENPQAGQEEKATQEEQVLIEEILQAQPEDEVVETSEELVNQGGDEERKETVQANDPEPALDKKEASREEIARIYDKKYDEGIESLTQKEKEIFFKEKNRRKLSRKSAWKKAHGIQDFTSGEQGVEEEQRRPEGSQSAPSPKDPPLSDTVLTPQDIGPDWRSAQSERIHKETNRWEIERVMDKKFVHGIESLTPEEQTIYVKERDRRKARDKARARSRQKPRKKPPLPKAMSRREYKKKIEAPGGCRLVFSVFLIMWTLIAVAKGSANGAAILAILSAAFIHPWIVHWKGSDPFKGFFQNEFLKEQKFRRGLGLLLLSFLMFGISKLFAVLLLIPAISMIVKSETYKNMTG